MINSTTTDRAGKHELTRDLLLDIADRTVVRHEFVIVYEEPIGNPYTDAEDRRGYLTVWERDIESAKYDRIQMVSGDDEWIQSQFSRLATSDVDSIESFMQLEHDGTNPQP